MGFAQIRGTLILLQEKPCVFNCQETLTDSAIVVPYCHFAVYKHTTDGYPCVRVEAAHLGSLQLPARGSNADHIRPAGTISCHRTAHVQISSCDVGLAERAVPGSHVLGQIVQIYTGGPAGILSVARIIAGRINRLGTGLRLETRDAPKSFD